jgi:peptidoglycan/LPS O-acetylase OafA/YrhL
MTEKPARQMEFEALRGLAIVLLLSLHSEIYDPIVFGETLKHIGFFVASFLLGSFFFLAGYFTEVSLNKPNRNLLTFAWSKFVRIYPPYWIAVILFVYYLEYSLKRPDMVVYAANLQAVFSPVFVKQLLTLWYISMLVVFYILFGGMMFAIRSSAGLAIVSAAVFGVCYYSHRMWGLFDPRFFQYYFIFLAGVYFCRFGGVREKLYNWNPLFKIAPAVLILFPLNWMLENSLTEGAEFLITVDLFILSWILMMLGLFRTGIGNWRIWLWLSMASYFTYLFHRPLWHFIDSSFGLQPEIRTVIIHLTVGSFLALTLGYLLQRGYDRLLAALRLK